MATSTSKIITNVIRKDLKDYRPAPNLLLNDKIRRMQNEGKTVHHFAFGQSPFPVMEKARLALAKHAGEKSYLAVKGIEPLRKAICNFHKKLDHLEGLNPDFVIVGPGSKELIFLMMNVFEGDVFLPYPRWLTYEPQARLSHHRPINISTYIEDEWRLTADNLEKAFQHSTSEYKLLVMCYPDNPTGTSYSRLQLQALTEVFRKYKVIVIADEIYGQLTFNGEHESLVKLYPEATILSSGLSKWAGAGGWRLGYHIYPVALQELFIAVVSAGSHTYSCASAPIQYAALSCFDLTDETLSYMKHTKRVLIAVADFCYKRLVSLGIKVTKPKGGFYMFPDFEIIREALRKRGIQSCQEMCDALFEEASVALMPWDTKINGIERLSVRFCYVNFDGEKALRASMDAGEISVLDDSFVTEKCIKTVEGVEALCEWVNKQKML